MTDERLTEAELDEIGAMLVGDSATCARLIAEIRALRGELALEAKLRTEALYQAELEAERADATRVRTIAKVVAWLRSSAQDAAARAKAEPAWEQEHWARSHILDEAADALASGALDKEGG